MKRKLDGRGANPNFYYVDLSSGADPGFPVGGDAKPPGGANTPFFQNFQKNYMKLRTFWDVGGTAPYIRHWSLLEQCTHSKSADCFRLMSVIGECKGALRMHSPLSPNIFHFHAVFRKKNCLNLSDLSDSMNSLELSEFPLHLGKTPL